MRFGELGMALDQLAVLADRFGRIFSFQGAQPARRTWRTPCIGLGCGGELRIDRLGSNPPSFEAGMMKMGSVPIDSQ